MDDEAIRQLDVSCQYTKSGAKPGEIFNQEIVKLLTNNQLLNTCRQLYYHNIGREFARRYQAN